MAITLAGAGCLGGARSAQMTVAPASITAQPAPALRGGVVVRTVRGGRGPSALGLARIGGEDFEAALVQSLREADLLAPSGAGARYALDAEIVESELADSDQTILYLQKDQSVTSTIRYVLTDTRTGSALLDRRIEVPFTASNRTSKLNARRTQVAHEGSARESIESLIDELARLRPPADAEPSAG